MCVLLEQQTVLKLSDGIFGEARRETVTIVHPAGDEGMNEFL